MLLTRKFLLRNGALHPSLRGARADGLSVQVIGMRCTRSSHHLFASSNRASNSAARRVIDWAVWINTSADGDVSDNGCGPGLAPSRY
jgi:hypothetical protein